MNFQNGFDTNLTHRLLSLSLISSTIPARNFNKFMDFGLFRFSAAAACYFSTSDT